MTGDYRLELEINQCPHFEPTKGDCCIKNECYGLYGITTAQTKPKYIRQPRWYEKYY